MSPRDALNITSEATTVVRSSVLGLAPAIISNTEQLPLELAGGTRLFKVVLLPFHANDLRDHVIKSFDDRKEAKRDIHVASAINYGANVIEDAGLIGLGLEAVKVTASKTLLAVAAWFSTVGFLLQAVTIYIDFRKYQNGVKHLDAIEKKDPGYLDDKTQFRHFSDAVGMKRKVISKLFGRVLHNTLAKKEDASTDEVEGLTGRFIVNIKSRVELGILTRKVGILLAIGLTFAGILMFFPPTAIAAWSIIGLCAVASIGYAVYRLVTTHYLNKEMRVLIK